VTGYVQTADGVRIAYDRVGSGQPLVMVGGAGQFRAVDPDTGRLATALAGRGFDVVVYDRPGRGDSGGDPPFGLAGEVAAIRALVDLLGGRTWLYGSSSGGAVALAAAAGLGGIERLLLWEVPLDEEGGTGGAEALAAVRALVAAGDREGIWRYWTDGMPPEWFEAMRTGPHWPLFLRMAPALEADAEALAWTQSAPRARLWESITAPAAVLLGTSTFPFMADAADSIVAALPHAERVEVPGRDHGWEPGAMAAVLAAVRGQERSGREPVELTPGTCPARKASTKSRWSSCVWRA
jgi:pimeloyl-ACP methyl ester carboxylesterase